MRKTFFETLHQQMSVNENIFFTTGDLGFGLANRIKEDFPDRFINTGAAEVCLVGTSVGLAMEGKIVFCYSITPFLLWRAAEVIRNYVNKELIPVKLIGSGREHDYSHDGFSHYAGDDVELMSLFPAVKSYWPQDKGEIPDLVQAAIVTEKPFYVNLKR